MTMGAGMMGHCLAALLPGPGLGRACGRYADAPQPPVQCMSLFLSMRMCVAGPWSGVGKTCLLQRFVDDVFSPNYVATIGVDFKSKEIRVGDRMVKIQVCHR